MTDVQINSSGTNGISETWVDLVSYDCNAESAGVALQAIKGAITVAKLVQRVWNLTEYEPFLRMYMGDNCGGNENWQKWIQSKSLSGLEKY